MVIKEIGKYVLIKDFTMRGSTRIGTTPKGTVMEVTQVDSQYKKVIGPKFYDWVPWDLPVEKL